MIPPSSTEICCCSWGVCKGASSREGSSSGASPHFLLATEILGGQDLGAGGRKVAEYGFSLEGIPLVLVLIRPERGATLEFCVKPIELGSCNGCTREIFFGVVLGIKNLGEYDPAAIESGGSGSRPPRPDILEKKTRMRNRNGKNNVANRWVPDSQRLPGSVRNA